MITIKNSNSTANTKSLNSTGGFSTRTCCPKMYPHAAKRTKLVQQGDTIKTSEPTQMTVQSVTESKTSNESEFIDLTIELPTKSEPEYCDVENVKQEATYVADDSFGDIKYDETGNASGTGGGVQPTIKQQQTSFSEYYVSDAGDQSAIEAQETPEETTKVTPGTWYNNIRFEIFRCDGRRYLKFNDQCYSRAYYARNLKSGETIQWYCNEPTCGARCFTKNKEFKLDKIPHSHGANASGTGGGVQATTSTIKQQQTSFSEYYVSDAGDQSAIEAQETPEETTKVTPGTWYNNIRFEIFRCDGRRYLKFNDQCYSRAYYARNLKSGETIQWYCNEPTCGARCFTKNKEFKLDKIPHSHGANASGTGGGVQATTSTIKQQQTSFSEYYVSDAGDQSVIEAQETPEGTIKVTPGTWYNNIRFELYRCDGRRFLKFNDQYYNRAYYARNLNSGETIQWDCSEPTCGARCFTKNKQFKFDKIPHSHGANGSGTGSAVEN